MDKQPVEAIANFKKGLSNRKKQKEAKQDHLVQVYDTLF